MQGLDELIAASPVFAGLPARHLDLIAGCARNEHVERGALLFREGADADRFFLIRKGAVALELPAPGRGPLRIRRFTTPTWPGGRGCFPRTAGSSTAAPLLRRA
jgi:hypothetical protein